MFITHTYLYKQCDRSLQVVWWFNKFVNGSGNGSYLPNMVDINKQGTKQCEKLEKGQTLHNYNSQNTLSHRRYLASTFRLRKPTRLLGNSKLNCVRQYL